MLEHASSDFQVLGGPGLGKNRAGCGHGDIDGPTAADYALWP